MASRKTKFAEEVTAVENITRELIKKEIDICNNWKLYCQKKLEIKYLEA
jgi:hypothetical protein